MAKVQDASSKNSQTRSAVRTIRCANCDVPVERLNRERSPCCSDECRRARAQKRERSVYLEAKKSGAQWGVPQAATPTRIHPLQHELQCDACSSTFYRYVKNGRSKRGAKFCSVVCRRKSVAKWITAQRGIPRIPRTDPQQCTKCKAWHPLAAYYVSKSSGLPMRRCPACVQPSVETKRRSHLRQTFGIEIEELWSLYDAQDGLCRICEEALPSKEEINRPTSRQTRWADRNWNIDHCHRSGLIRGILCRGCNQALGALRDRPEVARAAAEYLEAHQASSAYAVRLLAIERGEYVVKKRVRRKRSDEERRTLKAQRKRALQKALAAPQLSLGIDRKVA